MLDFGSQTDLSCSTVRQVTGFSGLATTVRASLAIWSSAYSTPPFSQAAISSSPIASEASLASVSPAQNFSKPPPVPEVPTVTLTSGFSPWNCSAIASVRGATVLDPSMRIVPDTASPPLSLSSSSPHAATPRASTLEAPRTSHHLLDIKLLPCLVCLGRPQM